MRTKGAAGAGVPETGEALQVEEEVLPAAGAVPEVLAHQGAVPDVLAEVPVLPEAVPKAAVPEAAGHPGTGM